MKAIILSLVPLTFFVALAGDHVRADQPFNGADLVGWSFKQKGSLKSQWVTGTPQLAAASPKALTASGTGGAMVNVVTGHGQSIDIYSDQKWGSSRIELEVLVDNPNRMSSVSPKHLALDFVLKLLEVVGIVHTLLHRPE